MTWFLIKRLWGDLPMCGAVPSVPFVCHQNKARPQLRRRRSLANLNYA
jgi:hypothetical protein